MAKKGEYGYLKDRLKRQALLSTIGIVIIIVTIIVGYLRYHTRNNMFTIAAALVALPTAKVLVGFIICIKNKSPEKEKYLELKEKSKTPYILSDLLLTSKENMMPFEFGAINNNNVWLYTSNKKIDKKKSEDYIKSFFGSEIKNVNVRIIDDYNVLLKTVSKITPKEDNNYELEEKIKNTLMILQY